MKRLVALATTLAAMLPAAVQACVGCRQPGADTTSFEPQTITAGFGFSWGVLLMLGCVFALLGALITLICRAAAALDRQHEGH